MTISKNSFICECSIAIHPTINNVNRSYHSIANPQKAGRPGVTQPIQPGRKNGKKTLPDYRLDAINPSHRRAEEIKTFRKKSGRKAKNSTKFLASSQTKSISRWKGKSKTLTKGLNKTHCGVHEESNVDWEDEEVSLFCFLIAQTVNYANRLFPKAMEPVSSARPNYFVKDIPTSMVLEVRRSLSECMHPLKLSPSTTMLLDPAIPVHLASCLRSWFMVCMRATLRIR